MKLFKVKRGVLVEREGSFYLQQSVDWDNFVNDDQLYKKLKGISEGAIAKSDALSLIEKEVEAPIQSQEVWAAGVTYYSSKMGRQEESAKSGGSDFYARVYEADRPELFFKSSPHRVVGSGKQVNIRKDSTWNVPEPELTLLITSSGKIVGYTIGNDMSSRSIEGENPLYLPQAKTYDGSAAIGPCIYITDQPLPTDTKIQIQIVRNKKNVFEGSIAVDQIKRKFTDLANFLYRECSFPCGCLLMTGTGIVPGKEFTLEVGDEITITIDSIGSLMNVVGHRAN